MKYTLIHLFGTALLAFALLVVAPVRSDAADSRIDAIRNRGELQCGVWPHVAGFSARSGENYVGFDIDFCRAVAAAIFGDPSNVRFVALADISQFRQLDEVDLVIRRLTWTLEREKQADVRFGPVTFYDGQAVLVPRDSGVTQIDQLAEQGVCVQDEERLPDTLLRHFLATGHVVRLVIVDSDAEAGIALSDGRCQGYSADLSWLAAARVTFDDGPAGYRFLPTLLSREPLAPMVRASDPDLLSLVRWTVYTLIEAEELGVTASNVTGSEWQDQGVQRFLGIHPGLPVAPSPGAWASAIISGVGNYGEIFARNLGADSPLKLERGQNRLWSDGGLLFAPPLDR